MSTTNPNANLYDAITNESFLMESMPLQDRKGDLRQIMKLLNLSKSGQAKVVLVSGDPGIGKTSLLNALVDMIRQGLYCRVVDLRHIRLESVEKLYIDIIEALQREAEDILEDGLKAVNEVTGELGLQWDRQDLLRSIALVKLQESLGGKDAVSQERLVKAIKSSVSPVKKLKFTAVNESIEKLVDILVNPWLLVAATLINPLTPPLQEALQLAHTLKNGGDISDALNLDTDHGDLEVPSLEPIRALPSISQTAGNLEDTGVLIDSSVLEASADSSLASKGSVSPNLYSSGAPLDAPLDVIVEDMSVTEYALPVLSKSTQTPTPQLAAVTTPAKAENPQAGNRQSSSNPVEALARQLQEVIGYIDRTINGLESSLVMVMDDWDKILDLPENRRNDMIEFMSTFLRDVQERKSYHFMFALACRTQGESYSLGGTLYNQFRNKILLTGLTARGRRKLILNPLKQEGYQVDEDVVEDMLSITMGNPFWLLKMQKYIQERASANGIQEIDRDFSQKLGIFELSDILEFMFTRIRLAFLHDESQLYKVIATLIQHFSERSFHVEAALREISLSQDLPELTVYDALRLLFQYDFLMTAPDPHPDPHYRFQSRLVLEFLKEKTKSVQADVSSNEKIVFLKRIIPLSVRSGELDREKTREILALSRTLGDTSIVCFLEETFSEYLEDPKPIVRATALNNIAAIETQTAIDAVIRMTRDPSALVREYAVRNLADLARKPQHLYSEDYHEKIMDSLICVLEDEVEVIRRMSYNALVLYKSRYDLASVFIKGMSDAAESIRLIVIQQLTDGSPLTSDIKKCVIEALVDASPAVRKHALQGVRNFSESEAVAILVTILSEDTDNAMRAQAADILSLMETPAAFDALVHTYYHDAPGENSSPEEIENLRVAIIRAIGKKPGWKTEEILLDTLSQLSRLSEYDAPGLLWTAIRTLGNVGRTKHALLILREFKKKTTSDFIHTAIETAIRKIDGRLQDMQPETPTATTQFINLPVRMEEAEVVTVMESQDVSGYSEKKILLVDDLVENPADIELANPLETDVVPEELVHAFSYRPES